MTNNAIRVKSVKPTREELVVWADIDKNIAKGDFAIATLTTGGQQIIELSASPLYADKVSEILFNDGFKPSFMTEYGFSISQRTKGIYAFLGVESLEHYNEEFSEYTIASISQTTGTLTVTLNEPFSENIGYWCDIYGLNDNRFNYANLNVGGISADKKTLTFTASDDIVLPSLTATPVSIIGGKLKCHSLFSNNFARFKYVSTTSSRAHLMSRFNGGKYRVNSTTLNSTPYTDGLASTLPYIINWQNGNAEVKSLNRPKITMNEDTLRFMDSACDNNGTYDTTRGTFTEVKPSFFQTYRNIMRLVTPKSIVKPIAKIVSAVKSGSNAVIVTTDVPHNLIAGVSFVGIGGVRDSSNFPVGTQIVSGVTSPTIFIVPIGSSATSTSYGGFVYEGNGQVLFPSLSGITAQSISRDVIGLLSIVGNSGWSGLVVGEYVDLYGCLGATGNDLGLDGVYKIFNVNGTSLILEPVKNIDGTYATDGEGNQLSPSGNVINTTNCGGTVIVRTTLRMHDISAISYQKQMVQIEGQGINDPSLAIPIIAPVGLPVVGGTFAGNSGSMSGQLNVQPAVGYTSDINSAAITSTSTTSVFNNYYGNGFQVSIPVTAVSGTNPTLDVRIEESLDGGTNWVTLYDFQRITATGIYSSPMLRATGRHIRYVQTVGGTSPSFTRSITRNISPMIPAEPQKRLIDRSIVLTTLNSVTPILFQGAANNVQLVINLGAATTPPAIQLEGSEDGVNWYAMGAPLTGVANSSVQLTVNSLSATFTRARVSTVGVGVTMGYVAIKAWS